MNREEFRKALDSEREVYRKQNPLPPWARTAVTHMAVGAFVSTVIAIAFLTLGFAYFVLRVLWFFIQ